MTEAELNFFHRWIDLEALYWKPLPVDKISLPPGREGPPTKFLKIWPWYFFSR